MSQIFAPLLPEYTINLPKDPAALVVWVLLFLLLILIVYKFRDKGAKIDRSSLIWMAILSVLVLGLTPFFGMPVDVNIGSSFGQSQVRYLMFFAAVPWLVAGGVIGIVPAGMLAAISGLLFSYLQTHQIFTPLIFVSLAIVFSWGVRQRYRTFFFRMLRFPLFSALFSLAITAPLIYLTQVLIIPGEFPLRIAVASGSMPSILIAYGGMLGMGGLISALIRAIFSQKWGMSAPPIPAPGEQSLKARFLLRTLPFLLVLLISFFGIVWQINLNSARRNLVSDMVNTSSNASQSWTAFIDAGRAEMDSIGAISLSPQGESIEFIQLLTQGMEGMAFFNQIVLLNPAGDIITSYPQGSELAPVLVPDRILSAVNSLEAESTVVINGGTGTSDDQKHISFIKAVSDTSNQESFVLWGQTNLLENPFSRPFITAFTNLEKNQGFGQIIDTSGRVFFSTLSRGSSGDFTGEIYTTPTYFMTTLDDSDYFMQYFYPVENSEWAVLSSIPAVEIYFDAWGISYPIFLLGFGILAVVIVVFMVLLSPIAKDLNTISTAIERAVEGEFDDNFAEPLAKGEIATLFEDFHLLRNTLGSRLKRQANMLSLDEEITNQNNLPESLNAIMKAALTREVSCVRMILFNTSGQGSFNNGNKQFSLGEDAEVYRHFDEEIIARVRANGELILRDYQIEKSYELEKGVAYPSSLVALPLVWQGIDQGVFWLASRVKKSISHEDLAFFRDLSDKASMMIAKGNRINDVLSLKDLLQSSIDVLPDGVVLLDPLNKVVYLNPSARSMLDLQGQEIKNQKITSLIKDQILVDCIMRGNQDNKLRVFTMADEKICQVFVSPADSGTGKKGQAVVFKDITQAREQNSIKSEFVTTASHELRSPLTLIHGYAKLLRLSGNLNEQQDAYINNIIDGVEELKILVQNLLDIGRLEPGHALDITRLSASELAKNVNKSMHTYAKQKNIHLNLLLPDEVIEFDGDEIFMAQALKNLIENAIKFTKMGGDVSLAVHKKEDSVVFAVKDNGIGIAPLDQQHLFEKFGRIGSSLGQESRGSGLGLAIVKSIAERHGGKVWFESQLGRGSIFYLEIPQKHGKIMNS